MGIEYFLLKPRSKEYFYLGKHFPHLDGIVSSTYRQISTQKDLEQNAEYLAYTDSKELLVDIIKNSSSFQDLYLETIIQFVDMLFEWCTEPVIIINDSSFEYSLIKDYRETGCILKFLKEFKDTHDNLFTLYEDVSELLSLIPSKYWITQDNILQTVPTLAQYIKLTRGLIK